MRLADIFCDHMVLQRDREICVFGTGNGAGSIEFDGEQKDFTAENGAFRVYLRPRPAGGPYEMKVTLNGEERVLQDILIGEVYIAGGQSNMEFTLKETGDPERVNNGQVRFFTEPTDANEKLEMTHRAVHWQLCEGDAADDFSAIGYYFAAALQKHIGVPVGIVSCCKGASRVDAWTAPESMQTQAYREWVAVRHGDYGYCKFNHDSWLYTNKLLPIAPFAAAGVLWYQGESNRAHEEGVHYAKMLEVMIHDWRQLWAYPLPFYCVQLMPFAEPEENADWAIIRAQQELAAKTIDGVYLTTLVDTGEEQAIHPLKKRPVAAALVNAVRCAQFGQSVEYCGPVLDAWEKSTDAVVLHFGHAEGLHIKGETLKDLQICGENGAVIPAAARVEGSTLCLSGDFGGGPVTVAMGYHNVPVHNLYNAAGYLASPFRVRIV